MQSHSFLRLSCVEDKKYVICSQNLDDERKYTILVKHGEEHENYKVLIGKKNNNIPEGNY